MLILIATTALPRLLIPRRVGVAVFYTLAEKHDVDVFLLSLYEIDKRLAELGVITKVFTFIKPRAPQFDSALTHTQKIEKEL